MNAPALIFWALIAWSVTARPRVVLVLLLASMNFPALALLPTDLTFSMAILPQFMFAVVLILKVVAPEAITLSPKLIYALQLRHLGYLALFLLVGLVVTVIMPRLFLGDVVIIPMRVKYATELLVPIQQNFTQSGYVTLSVLTTFAVMLTAKEPGFSGAFLLGVLAAGAVCLAAGIIDMAAASTGMGSLLDSLRTADYAYLTDASTAGGRRVVGFAPEASSYGPICADFAVALGLFRPLYAEKKQQLLAAVIAVGLVIMAVLTTSSTAYGGLAVMGLILALNWVRRAVSSQSLVRIGLVSELIVGAGLLIAILFILLARANLFDPLLDLVQEVILNKPQSSSFYERSEWNTVAWDTVASTWGLGVGFGSTRTSNWFVSIISNAGIIGAALMGIFLVQTFFRRPIERNQLSAELLTTLKLSLLPPLIMSAVVAPGPDFGPWLATAFGAIAGIAAFPQRPSPVNVVAAGRPRLRTLVPREAWSPSSGRMRSPQARPDRGSDKPVPRQSF